MTPGADPYLDPLGGVLLNTLGLRDPERLARRERDASRIRDVELTLRPEPGAFDLAHLCRNARCSPTCTRGRARSAPASWPAALPSPTPPSSWSAHYLAEVNALHPFREGNGRAQRAFFRHLAAEAGWRLDWSLITPERNDTPSQRSLSGDVEPLRRLLDEIAGPL